MNKSITAMVLAVACIQVSVCAQEYLGNTPKELSGTRTEQIFGSKADYLNHKLIIHLTNENRVIVQLNSMRDLPAVINLDSLFREVLKDAEPLKDSLQAGLNAKKIDYIIDTNGTKKVRIITHPAAGSTYAVKGGDIALLKIEQDTLRVKGFTKNFARSYVFPYKQVREQKYWEVTFLVNDLLEIPAYLNGTLTNTMKKISEEYITKTKWTGVKDKNLNFTANYYPYDKEKPGKSVYTGSRPAITLIWPSIRFGLETVRNSFGGSISEGISVNIKKGNTVKLYTVYWDILFLHDRDNIDNWRVNRYEFITLQWSSINSKTLLPENKYNKFTLDDKFSISYLIRGNGNYFEENTFKLGLAGLRYRMFYLYPQIVWNKYPSISFRLTLGW